MGDTGKVSRALISVFAVEDTTAQVVWRALPAAQVSLRAGDREVQVTATPPAWLRRRGCPPRRLANRSDAVGGPGAVVIDGLRPDTPYHLTIGGPGLKTRVAARFRTLPSPPGRLLCRFATVNDIHIGEAHFGAAGSCGS